MGQGAHILAIEDPIAALILASLRNGADARGMVQVDIAELSRLANCAPSAAQKALRRLAAAGQIEPVDLTMTCGVRLTRAESTSQRSANGAPSEVPHGH